MNTRRKVATTAVAALATLGVGVAVVNTGEKGPATPPTTTARTNTQPGTADQAGAFSVICTFNESRPDDPIVHPGHPGGSHLHDFVGAKGITAFTTPASIRGGATSCDEKGDTSGYWTPAMYVCVGQAIGTPCSPTQPNAVKINPIRFILRYSAGGKGPTVSSLPKDAEMVAGARLEPTRPSPETDWSCFNRAGEAYERNTDFRGCPPEFGVRMSTGFPDCWDGVNVTSTDDRSHMAYARNDRSCPNTHPVPVVKLLLTVDFGAGVPAGPIVLASGKDQSQHADFMMAWTDRFETLVQRCIRERQTRCERLGA